MTSIDRFIQRWRIKEAAAFLEPSDAVLDIGTADGALFTVLPYLKNGIGIDPDAETYELNNARLIRGLFPQALPDDRRFDAITMLAVLEHIPVDSQKQLARDCYNRLRAKGRLIITVPSPRVDDILKLLRAMRLIHGMALEQHYGYEVDMTPDLFGSAGLRLTTSRKFQLGLNNLFVFEKPAE